MGIAEDTMKIIEEMGLGSKLAKNKKRKLNVSKEKIDEINRQHRNKDAKRKNDKLKRKQKRR